MSFTKAKAYLESVGFADHIMEPEASTATVMEATGNDHSSRPLDHSGIGASGQCPRMGGCLQGSSLKRRDKLL